MDQEIALQRVSQLQDEILQFTWEQLGDEVEKFYVQGKITEDETGNITSYNGNLEFVVVAGKILNNLDVASREDLRMNARFVGDRVIELRQVLLELQGKSPARFRWSVDTKTGQVDSDWTYYDDLTEEEKKDDFWEGWKGDFAWKAELEAELASQQ